MNTNHTGKVGIGLNNKAAELVLASQSFQIEMVGMALDKRKAPCHGGTGLF